MATTILRIIDRAVSAPGTVYAIAALALVLRVIVVFVVGDWRSPEDWEYGIVARNLLDGNGFSGSAWFVPEGPTAFMAPVYVYLLYGTLLVFGGGGYLVLQLGQAAVGGLCAGLVYRLAHHTLGGRVALLAGVLYAVHPTHAYLAVVIHPLLFITVFLLATLTLLVRLCERRTVSTAIGLGVCYGVALLTDPAILCILPILVAAPLLTSPGEYRGWGLGVAAFAMAALVVSPWTVRNYLVFDQFVPIKSQFGYILWVGNHPGATGTQTVLDETGQLSHVNHRIPEELEAELSMMSEPDAYSTLGDIAVNYMVDHPTETALRTVKKAGYYWCFPYWHINPQDRDGPWLAHIRRPEEVIWIAVLVAGLVGLWLRREDWRRWLVLVAPMACYTALYAATNVGSGPRYRIPIEPLVMMFAAVTVLYALTRRKNDGDKTCEESPS